MRRHAVHTLLACLVVYFVWGTTYPAIGLMLAPPQGQGLPPFFATGGRLLVAGSALLIMGQLSVRGRTVTKGLTRRQVRAAIIAGFFLCFSTASLVAGAAQRLPSGAVASYLATAPIWATLMLAVSRRKAPGARVSAGLALGLAGVVVLSGSDITADTVGIGLALGGAVTWAFGSWYTSHSPSFPQHIWISGGLSQLTSGAGLILVALTQAEQIPLPITHASQASFLAFGYLALVSLTGLTTYSWLLRNRDPLIATTHSFINPLVAACVGAVALSEGLSLQLLIAAAMVGGGALLTMSTSLPPEEATEPQDGPSLRAAVQGRLVQSTSTSQRRNRTRTVQP